MEQKIIISINNKKKFSLKGKLSLKEIIEFIRKEYRLQPTTKIDIYNKNFEKINNQENLEKFKEKYDNNNTYIIRINFKIQAPTIRMTNPTEIQSSNKSIRTYVKKTGGIEKKRLIINNNFKKGNSGDVNQDLAKSVVFKPSLSMQLPETNQQIEDKKINEEVKKIKQEQEKKIESLEKELAKLKGIYGELEKDGDDNNNITFINKLKDDIINEIKSKIEVEKNDKIKKINEINNNLNNIYIDKKIEELKQDIINNEIKKPLNEMEQKIKDMEDKFNNNSENNIIINLSNIEKDNPKQKRVSHNTYTRQNKKKENDNNNIKYIDLDNNGNNNININYKQYINKSNISANPNQYNNYYKKNSNKIDKNPEDINEEDINNIDLQKINIQLSNTFNRSNNLINNNNPNNLGEKKKNYFDMKEKEKPKQIRGEQYIDKKENPPIEKKKSKTFNLLPLLTKIFFRNQQMTEINPNRVNENITEAIISQYIKNPKEIEPYVQNFIQVNVLPYFKKPKIPKDIIDILKYNISSVLKCINISPDYYSAYYYPELKKQNRVSRRSSVEAARKFKKEFNISEGQLNEEVLINKLNENNNDIYQTFGQIYGI